MATVADGSSITFGTSAFAAELLEVSDWSVSRASIDTTHMGSSNAKSFVESELYDPGELSLRFAYDSGDDPPYDQASETITVYLGSTDWSWAATGFMTNFSVSAAMENQIEATATIKLSGAITITT